MKTWNKRKMGHFFSDHSQEIALILIILVFGTLVQIRTGGSFLSTSNLNELMREASMLIMVSRMVFAMISICGIHLIRDILQQQV